MHKIHFSNLILVPTRPPLSPTGEAVSPRSLLLSWSPPPPEHQNGIIRHYLVKITESETYQVFQHMTHTTSLSVPMLHPYYTYQWRVSAYTVGEGPYTNVSTVRTPEDSEYHSCLNFIILMFVHHHIIESVDSNVGIAQTCNIWQQE